MNSLSRTEFRTVTDRHAQARLERMLTNRRAAERARADKFRKPPTQPEPANFCASDDDVPPALTARQLIAAGLAWLVAMLASLWLCTEAGMRFLDAIWRLS